MPTDQIKVKKKINCYRDSCDHKIHLKMNKIIINNEGAWFDIDNAKSYEARSVKGAIRNEILYVTPGNKVIKSTKKPQDQRPTYTLQSLPEARHWFRLNKYTQEEIPEFLRDFHPDLEIC